jgi:hypothetical protein
MAIIVGSLSCPRAEGIPSGNAGIHFENKDAFVDSRFSQGDAFPKEPFGLARGNDKLGHY